MTNALVKYYRRTVAVPFGNTPRMSSVLHTMEYNKKEIRRMKTLDLRNFMGLCMRVSSSFQKYTIQMSAAATKRRKSA